MAGTYGTFTRAGYTQEAGTPSEAVKLEYDGWARLPDEAVEPPPLGGAGSGTEEWAKYADELAVPVPDAAKRDDIVTAVRDAGFPVGDDQ